MKHAQYLVFAAMLIPTLVVAIAATVSMTAVDPEPEYPAPVMTTSNAGLHPAEMTTDE